MKDFTYGAVTAMCFVACLVLPAACQQLQSISADLTKIAYNPAK